MVGKYDVVVVGAGPAGIPAAINSSKYGAKTLLLEKNEVIMARKPCGEATSLNTFRDMGIEPKPYIVLHKVIPRVYAPNGKYINISNTSTYSINKTMYLQELALRAAEEGAEIHVRERVENIVRHGDQLKVKTNRDMYIARVVIGADGYNSIVARCMGVREKSEPIPTVVYLMVNIRLEDYETARFYLGRDVAPKGYAWIFPRGEKVAEVGIGVRGGRAKDYLDRFIKRHSDELGSGQIIDYRGAVVPIGGLINENIGDNFILIGDAAGTVIPLTGAGIHASGVAGLAAGKVAAEAISENNVSRSFLSRWRIEYREWIDKIRFSLKVMRFLERLGDKELNELADILEPDDIVRLANGIGVGDVARRLLRRPGIALRLARSILF